MSTTADDRPLAGDTPIPHDARWLSRFRRAVKTWYGKHGRHLPWRESADPYRIWISEIMLQQTTVTAVVPYFQRFLARFPTLAALAEAEEADVLHAWEGLGYYSRARNLHRTAQVLMSEYGGIFPHDAAALQSLPGIGRYTAGAIASFAFQQRAPIVEANTLRLYTRLLGYSDNPKSSRGQSLLWEFAERILPATDAGPFNQALMDIGATICTPENPGCTSGCPLNSQCNAFATSRQHLIPALAPRAEVTPTVEAAIVVRNGDQFLLHQRPVGARWAGLWDFPRFLLGDDAAHDVPLSARQQHAYWCEAERHFTDVWNQPLVFDRFLTEIVHHVTRYRIRLICFMSQIASQKQKSPQALESIASSTNHKWVAASQFDDYAMPVSGRKLAKLIAKEPVSSSKTIRLRRK